MEIDNLSFSIRHFQLKLDTNHNNTYIAIWGNKPNATTISLQSISKIENLFWKTTNIRCVTKKGAVLFIYSDSYIEDDLIKFLETQSKEEDKIVSVLAEMNTKLNKTIHYKFTE